MGEFGRRAQPVASGHRRDRNCSGDSTASGFTEPALLWRHPPPSASQAGAGTVASGSMATLPRALLWRRIDTTGTDLAFVDDRRGFVARGVVTAGDPLPHACRYELSTDERWASVRLEVTAEGAGWLRTARLERAAGRWRVTTAEQGDLDAALRASGRAPAGLPGTEEPERLTEALDVDLGGSPLTNTLPIRRLGLLSAPPGTTHTIVAAWVLVPSLRVLPAQQTYTVLEGGRIRYSSASFTAALSVDANGYVTAYPGLAEAAG